MAIAPSTAWPSHTSPTKKLARRIASPGRIALIRELGCQSAMVLPLVARGRLLGALTYDRLIRPFLPAVAKTDQ